MTTTLTADVEATLRQIAELTAAGWQILRVAVPSEDDGAALPVIVRKSQIPVIADIHIHFQSCYVFAAIDAGCAAVRVNPGNIRKVDDKVGEIARAAADGGISIRIGVNAGSLDPRLPAKHGKMTPQALVESALWECSLFEEHGFTDVKISVKHHDPLITVRAYRLLAQACDYPLHLGVTEAWPAPQGTIKSAVAFGVLLAEGIGDTIRVSLSDPPVEEVRDGISILESLGLRKRGLEIVSYPRAAGHRSTSTISSRRSSQHSTDSHARCGSRLWDASSTAQAKPSRPTSVPHPATAKARSSYAARSCEPYLKTRSSPHWSKKPSDLVRCRPKSPKGDTT